MFRLAYNTNGLAHHRVGDALRLLAELGYEGVAITPDVGALDPFDLDPAEVARVRGLSEELGLTLAIETGARFVLDPRRKHAPTLLEERADERARRVDFLCRCVDLAAELGADTVSLWAGRAPGGEVADRPAGGEEGHGVLWERLRGGLSAVLERARTVGVRLAFEPEPGMFIERPAGFRALLEELGSEGGDLGLCLDVGHLLCTGDLPVGDVIRRHGDRLAMVHLDDIRAGVHRHRMFGEGDLDLPGTLKALFDVGYDGIAAVELSRDSHRGASAAAEAIDRIRQALATVGA